VPYVEVDMAGGFSGRFVPVIGKVDTGASLTMLTFSTASELGIQDPKIEAVLQDSLQTATGEKIPYYAHFVSVRIGSDPRRSIAFVLMAGFSEKIERNLLGIDWLDHLCLAFDKTSVHFLRD